MSASALIAGSALATAAAKPQASRTLIVLRVADRDHVVRRNIQFGEGRLQAARLVDAGRQHHDGSLVEDDLQLQSEFPDGLEDRGLVGGAPA